MLNSLILPDEYICFAQIDIDLSNSQLEALITAQAGIQATADQVDEEIQTQLGSLTNFLQVGSALLGRQ